MTETTPSDRANRVGPDAVPKLRTVSADAPWTWLAAGWRDLWHAPTIGLTYGGLAFAMAALLAACLAFIQALPLFLTLAGGFLLLGPMIAVGLYEASRRMALSQPVSLKTVAFASAMTRKQLAFGGVFLLLMFFIWLRVAMLLFMLFMGTNVIPPPNEFTQLLLFTPHGLALLVIGTMVGGLFAGIVFVTTVVAVPLMLDRRIDVFTAAVASIDAVRANPKPMLLWAALIVVIMAAGFATLLVGLVVAFPLIGHATWHACADVYGEGGAGTPKGST
jgi:uncharacterized membrane protein